MTALTAEQLAEIKRRHMNAPSSTNSSAHYSEAHGDRRALLAHVEALERDAGRYRWLRDAIIRSAKGDDVLMYVNCAGEQFDSPSPQHIDCYFDSAISAEKAPTAHSQE